MKSVKLGCFGGVALKGFVVISATWTFFSVIMLLRWTLLPTSASNLETKIDYPTIKLPIVSPSTAFPDLPGVQQAFESFKSSTDSADQPVRLAVVFQSDSTCFVELTYISDCGCPSEKLDRYELTRTAIDPITGMVLTRLKEERLSAERLNRYFGGLTQIRRFQ